MNTQKFNEKLKYQQRERERENICKDIEILKQRKIKIKNTIYPNPR